MYENWSRYETPLLSVDRECNVTVNRAENELKVDVLDFFKRAGEEKPIVCAQISRDLWLAILYHPTFLRNFTESLRTAGKEEG